MKLECSLNTLHVLIYRQIKRPTSIFVMCLNTLHVLIYQCFGRSRFLCRCSLNTLHVLIYRQGQPNYVEVWVFKYITCSYLSAFHHPDLSADRTFKYITCSYLSAVDDIIREYYEMFKYITCSYLSLSRKSILFH